MDINEECLNVKTYSNRNYRSCSPSLQRNDQLQKIKNKKKRNQPVESEKLAQSSWLCLYRLLLDDVVHYRLVALDLEAT
jgi:hypothetical protein